MKQTELVVLVDNRNRRIGTMPKHLAHHSKTPLHRGLSVFLFNEKGEFLVQRRAMHKQTWPGVWSNSVCGHPLPGERFKTAAIREVKEEVGLEVQKLTKVSDYRYRFERNGMVENEICPVFLGYVKGEVTLDLGEVMDYMWLTWKEFKAELKRDKKGKWSEWCKEEAELVERFLFG